MEPPESKADDGKDNVEAQQGEKNKILNRLAKGTAQKAKKAVQGAAKATSSAIQGTGKAVAKVDHGKGKTSQRMVLGSKRGEEAAVSTNDHTPENQGEISGALFPDKSAATLPDSPQKTSDKTVVVGPWMEFLTADATIVFLIAIAIASYPTIQNWGAVVSNQIPFSVMGTWLLVAYATGQVFSSPTWKSSHLMFASTAAREVEAPIPSSVLVEPRQVETSEITQDVKRKQHSLLMTILGSRKRVSVKFGGVAKPVSSALKKNAAWSSLKQGRTRVLWQMRADPTKDSVNSNLMRQLLRNSRIRRVKRKASLVLPMDASAPSLDEDFSSEIGGFDLSKTNADSLGEFVVEPVLKLRGMDVFLTDDADMEVATHPWLIGQGLRDVPTMIVNVITQWGNILVYFELPGWVKDWDSIQENESDPDDDKALKVR